MMCLFNAKTPKVAPLETTAKELVPETTAQEPESPQYGGQDNTNKKKGRDALKIPLVRGYQANNI